MDTLSARTDFYIAVHDVRHITSKFIWYIVFIEAVVQVNGANSIKDSDTNAIVLVILFQLIKIAKGTPVVTFSWFTS